MNVLIFRDLFFFMEHIIFLGKYNLQIIIPVIKTTSFLHMRYQIR